MERTIKTGGLIASVIVLGAISAYLYVNDYKTYLIITATLTVIMAIVTVNYIFTNRSEESRYKSKVNQILKTYDSVLVKSNNLPKLEEKNIIRVESIEDLVDAQMEIRKPIYYQQQTESCSFVLLDNTEACIHIIKLNNSVTCPLEITLNEIELKHKNESKNTSDLSNIDSTAIVEVDDGKYIKVSPIRNEPVLTTITDSMLPPIAAMGNEQVIATQQAPVATTPTIPSIVLPQDAQQQPIVDTNATTSVEIDSSVQTQDIEATQESIQPTAATEITKETTEPVIAEIVKEKEKTTEEQIEDTKEEKKEDVELL